MTRHYSTSVPDLGIQRGASARSASSPPPTRARRTRRCSASRTPRPSRTFGPRVGLRLLTRMCDQTEVGAFASGEAARYLLGCRAGSRSRPTKPESARGCRLIMGRQHSRVAWSLVLPVALAEVLLLVATANRYGYHRDELYFRVAARHPAWGYDDQPALTPLLGRFSEWAFGSDPRGLRMLSAIAIGLVVVLVALLAREFGAGRAGQAVAALATAASGAAMAVGHLLSTTTFDVLLWVALVYVVARILGGGDERQWLLVGLVAGIGLENKHLILLLVSGSRVRLPPRAALGARPKSLALGGSRTRGRAVAAEPAVAGSPRLAPTRARRQDRRGGGSREPHRASASSVSVDRPSPRTAVARRTLVAPAPSRGSAVPSARTRLCRPARDRPADGREAVLHDGSPPRIARRRRRGR